MLENLDWKWITIPAALLSSSLSGVFTVHRYLDSLPLDDLGPAIAIESGYVTPGAKGEVVDLVLTMEKFLNCPTKQMDLTLHDNAGLTHNVAFVGKPATLPIGRHEDQRWNVRIPYTAETGISTVTFRATHHECGDALEKSIVFDMTFPTMVDEVEGKKLKVLEDLGPAITFRAGYITPGDPGEIVDLVLDFEKHLNCDIKAISLNLTDSRGLTYGLSFTSVPPVTVIGNYPTYRLNVRLPYTATEGQAHTILKVVYNNCGDGLEKPVNFPMTYPTLIGKQRKSLGGKGRLPSKRAENDAKIGELKRIQKDTPRKTEPVSPYKLDHTLRHDVYW